MDDGIYFATVKPVAGTHEAFIHSSTRQGSVMRQLLRRALRAAKGLVLITGMLIVAACGGGDGMGGGGYGGGGGGGTVAPTGLTYTAPATLNVGTAITPLSPTVTGTVTGYTVSPALPAGLALNATSGVISGTPTATAAQATYTITASNSAGSTTYGLAFKVDPAIPSAYTLSALVSDGAATAVSTDVHLKNPWGIAALSGGPAWVTNNHDHTSTVYDGTGLIQTTVVNIPAGANGPGDVTGIVASSSATDFQVTNGTTTAPARFIFVTESGSLAGWAPTVNATNAIVVYNDTTGAIYKGLALANNGTANFLYAADFHNNRIDVFDKTFAKVAVAGGFTDPTLPAGFAPFNIQAVTISGTTMLVVAYAKQDGTATEEVAGAGDGIVNTFDLNGTLLKHLIARGGQLNAPWGIAVAPANFGSLSNALLVGNFGDGKINGFDAGTGAFIHAVSDANHNAIVTGGLWALWFGNGGRNQPTNTLYLAAGINGEVNGLFARIDLGATAPDIVAPTGVAITAPAAASTVSGTVNITANATDNVGVASVKFQVRVGTTTTDIATDTSAPFSASWNSGSVANGAATLIATAFDAFGNSTASPGIAVTVNNVPGTTPPTLATLQATIFGPRCSTCHTGGGGTLPSSMNLSSASATLAALVNVTSLEEPTIKRVNPGSPNTSYLIQKLEGTQTVGVRMPAAGAFLTQAEIDGVRAWIQAGAAP
jgi:uncharacterized protein (TIGR03118 family)